jgi:hypothetical protein
MPEARMSKPRRIEEPWSLAAGWEYNRERGGKRGVLRLKPLSGGRPVTVRWRCEHGHDSTDAAVSCACIEKDKRWRARNGELANA